MSAIEMIEDEESFWRVWAHVQNKLFPGGSMLSKEIIEAGEQIASDLFDAQVSKVLGNLGGHIIKDISEYNNHDLVQKYLDGEIVSVEAIFTAMKRAEEKLKIE